MRDPESGQYARARNTNLNEDLGKVRRMRILRSMHRYAATAFPWDCPWLMTR